MTRKIRKALRVVAVAIVGAGCLLVSEPQLVLNGGSLITGAEARVGRPLTPVSYAGVARRTTRRAVAVGTTVGVGAAVARRCTRSYDVYGNLVSRCY